MQRFFEDLDRRLPAERGPNGEPSTNDFQVFNLLRIMEDFAANWDGLPELIPGRPPGAETIELESGQYFS